MANALEILINMRSDTTGAKAAESALKGVGTAADDAGKKVAAAGTTTAKFGDAASKVDAAGRNAKIGLNSMSQAAQLVGVDISGIVGVASSAADAIGDMTGAVGSLGAVAGVAGVALAAIALIASKLQAQHDATVATVIATDSYLQSMKAVTAGNAEAAASIQKIADELVTMREMGSRNPLTQIFGSLGSAKAQLDDFFSGLDRGIVRFRALADIIKENEDALNTQAFLHASDDIEKLRASANSAQSSLYGLGAAMREAASAAAQASTDTEAYYNNLQRVQGATNTAFYNTVQLNHATVGQGNALEAGVTKWDAYNKLIGQRYPISAKAAADATDDWMKSLKDTSAIDKAREAAQRLAEAFKGMVESAVGIPTFEEHLKKIANGGKDAYENLFRLDAVATGTNPADYGAGFEALAKQLSDMGYSAAQAAAGIRDFSIFAEHPELVTSGLIDMGAVIEDVKNQLLGMAGHANVVKEAMKQVWASLDPKQKAALAETGIDNATDAITALLDPTAQAKEQVKGLNTELGAIPRAITTTFNVVKDAAEQAVKDFRTVLDKFIADYGNVTISINAETSAGSAGGTTSSAAANPSAPVGAGHGFASGGWIVPPGYSNDTFPVRANLSSNEVMYIHNKGDAGGGMLQPIIQLFIDGERVRGRNVRMKAAHAQTG